MVNHFGTLSYGHYTSYCINQFNKKWYLYDDNQCFPISDESKLVKEAAYILFYVRKDV